MKLKVNDFSFPWPASGLRIEVEVEPGENGEEQAGPVEVIVRGGVLRIMPKEQGAAFAISAEEMSALFAWDKPIVYDPKLSKFWRDLPAKGVGLTFRDDGSPGLTVSNPD